jgi:hypothetical protein
MFRALGHTDACIKHWVTRYFTCIEHWGTQQGLVMHRALVHTDTTYKYKALEHTDTSTYIEHRDTLIHV